CARDESTISIAFDYW
nr:immunoglobulin heavy chain junction region [Macaca mulatta]